MTEEKKVYTTALIGAGARGVDQLAGRAVATGRFRFVAVCDPSQDGREFFKSRISRDVREFESFDDLMAWNDFDVAVITSPDFAHEAQAVACLEAGKDLLLEKPIAISHAGGTRVVEAAERNKRVVVVGFVLRYAPLYARAKELVDQGWIGKLTTIWVLHSVKSGSDWYFHDWHGTFANTGGLLLQKGSHDFDIINWFAGSRVQQVSAIGSRDVFGGDKPNGLRCPQCGERHACPERMPDDHPRTQCAFRREIDCLDNHMVLMEFENGVKASYDECHYTPDDNREYIFIGTKGKLKLDDRAGKLTMELRHSGDVMEYRPSAGREGHGGGDPRLIEDLAHAIDSRTQPLAGVKAGLESIRVGLMAHESIRRDGQVVRDLE